MASPGNRHCAYCIGALSFLIDTATLMVLLNSASARAIDEARGVMFSVCPSMCACLLGRGISHRLTLSFVFLS